MNLGGMNKAIEYLNSKLIESVWGFSLMSLSRDSIIRKGLFYLFDV